MDINRYTIFFNSIFNSQYYVQFWLISYINGIETKHRSASKYLFVYVCFCLCSIPIYIYYMCIYKYINTHKWPCTHTCTNNTYRWCWYYWPIAWQSHKFNIYRTWLYVFIIIDDANTIAINNSLLIIIIIIIMIPMLIHHHDK